MLKLEVFAGFESLLKRTSVIRAVPATSKDDLQVVVDLCIEWQVSEADATFARLAGVAEIEAAVCDKARRAFRLAMWDTSAEELADDSLRDPSMPTSAGTVSSRVSRECLELFDEVNPALIFHDVANPSLNIRANESIFNSCARL
jgi:hypothetical protein